MSVFNEKVINIDNDTVLHILDIKNLSNDLEILIDKNLSKIHSANFYNLERTKKILKNLLNIKENGYLADIKIGMIAEFFIHLYLKTRGFEQLCLFQNLESTKEIKKGHDGYYLFDKIEWLMESKSTRTEDNHKKLIKSAYDDLKNKVSGKNLSKKDGTPIDPWNNAWNHLHRVDPESSILEKIQELSNDFIDENYKDIKDFNIIPSSTMFLEDNLVSQIKTDIEKEVGTYVKNIDYTKANIICLTQETVDIFLEYLNK